MRIIDQRRDYYDSVQRNDEDRSLIYVRKEQDITVRGWPFPWYGYSIQSIKVNTCIIGFCGKIYGVLDLLYLSGASPSPTAFCYSIEDVDKFVTAYLPKKQKEGYFNERKSVFWRGCRRFILEFFDKCEKERSAHEKWFKIAKPATKSGGRYDQIPVPIFVADAKQTNSWPRDHIEYKLTYNPLLKPFEFFRVFDTYRAYQELSMWMGSEAHPNRPIPELTNDELIQSKGFDLKYSFRKEKSK